MWCYTRQQNDFTFLPYLLHLSVTVDRRRNSWQEDLRFELTKGHISKFQLWLPRLTSLRVNITKRIKWHYKQLTNWSLVSLCCLLRIGDVGPWVDKSYVPPIPVWIPRPPVPASDPDSELSYPLEAVLRTDKLRQKNDNMCMLCESLATWSTLSNMFELQRLSSYKEASSEYDWN